MVGFDDIEQLEMLNIHLTVVHRDTLAMGRQAMNLLIKRIADRRDENSKRLVMEPTMIMGGSEVKI